MSQIFENTLKTLITLPNIGTKNAKRIIIALSKAKHIAKRLKDQLEILESQVKECSLCNNLTTQKFCDICLDQERDKNQICIVSDVSSVWAIRDSNIYNGVFHVLNDTNIMETNNYIENELNKRIEDSVYQEFIIAMNPTIEGQAVTHYITSLLKKHEKITITTLALGMPIGSEIDYLDSSTIAIAIDSRKELL